MRHNETYGKCRIWGRDGKGWEGLHWSMMDGSRSNRSSSSSSSSSSSKSNRRMESAIPAPTCAPQNLYSRKSSKESGLITWAPFLTELLLQSASVCSQLLSALSPFFMESDRTSSGVENLYLHQLWTWEQLADLDLDRFGPQKTIIIQEAESRW